MLKILHNYSLWKQFIFLISSILIIIMISFTISNYIAINIIEENSMKSSNKILLQLEDKITTFYSDMDNIISSLIYSPTIKNFVVDDDVLERTLMYNDVISVFSNTFSLKENIEGIQLYNDDFLSIARSGNVGNINFKAEQVDKLTYTGILSVEGKSQSEQYYAIISPIFNLNNSSRRSQLGTCVVIMNTRNLNQLLKNSLITKNSDMILLDQNNEVIASEGSSDINYKGIMEAEDTNKYIIQKFTLAKTGWKIISIIPKKELFHEMDMVQKFNYVAYIIIAGIMLLFLLLFYIGILKPVNKLIRFMKEFPKNQKNNRVQDINDHNEIGKIAVTLNSMLDNIDKLSQEVQQSQKQIYEMEIIKKEMEVTSYRNQINPHFLYNVFECIRGMAFYHNAKDIADLTEAVSRLFRYSVKGNNYTTVEEEIAHIREYAKIIDYRFMGKINMQINADESLYKEIVIKILLQPIVENAVFHGLEKIVEDGFIRIDIERPEEDRIRFTVSDNGYGMEEKQLKGLLHTLENYDVSRPVKGTTHGVGLLNIYRRLKLFYHDQAEFVIQSKLYEGTTVVITVPLFRGNSGGEVNV